MQNLVVLMEESNDTYNISSKGGNMCLNRFSIDEDAAFELSGVHHLVKSSREIIYDVNINKKSNFKGKGYSKLTTKNVIIFWLP